MNTETPLTTQQILNEAANKTGDRFTTPDALCLTTDGKIVPDGHADSRYVLTGQGGSLPLALAQRLGLDKPAEVQEPTVESDAEYDESGEDGEPDKPKNRGGRPKSVKPGDDKAIHHAEFDK